MNSGSSITGDSAKGLLPTPIKCHHSMMNLISANTQKLIFQSFAILYGLRLICYYSVKIIMSLKLLARIMQDNQYEYGSLAKGQGTSLITATKVRDVLTYVPIALAKPKSHSLTTPLLEMRIFSGFTSRWMTYW